MEYEDQEEHEEEVEEQEMAPPSATNDSTRVKMTPASPGAEELRQQQQQQPVSAVSGHYHQQKPRYRECHKNHAVGIGGHAVDGCGEFMEAGTDSSLGALTCAACNCHRNFHRKETPSSNINNNSSVQQQDIFFPLPHHHHQVPQFAYYRSTGPAAGYLHVAPAQQRPLALPSTSDQEDVSNIGGSGGRKKRFRTKFTQEQKDKMLGLAERLGWRIQKQDEDVVRHFCSETGVKRRVLKVWMHNNKHTLGKKP